MKPNRRRSRRHFLAAAALLLSAAAVHAQSRTYTPGAFDAIEVDGSAVIRFVQGTVDQVVVEGDDAAQDAVEMDVRGGTLNIRQQGSWKFWNARRLQLVVTARTLRRVAISGAADLNAPGPVHTEKLVISISGAGSTRFDQLDAAGLGFHVSGAGNGQVAGRVRDLNVEISGKSKFQGENLQSERAHVAISGVGDVDVWARRQLSISVAGVGSVSYWGQPEVRRSVSGRADITPRGDKP